TRAPLVAGLPTPPYAASHFHRLAPYGVLANLLAMPVVSAVVMPAGILGLLALPFGFDAPCWQVMKLGIDWMDAVALWVASLPGAVGHMAAFSPGVLALGTVGLLVGCLLRTPLRLIGAAILLIACVLALRTVQPDVMVASSGDSFAVRGPEGRFQVIKLGNDAFAIREWLAADADARSDPRALAAAVKAREGFICDDAGCVARLMGGGLVAIAASPAAFADDCARAALVLTTRAAALGCGATVIDRAASRQGGALTLRWGGNGWAATATRPRGEARPGAAGGGGLPGSSRRSRARRRNAMPRHARRIWGSMTERRAALTIYSKGRLHRSASRCSDVAIVSATSCLAAFAFFHGPRHD